MFRDYYRKKRTLSLEKKNKIRIAVSVLEMRRGGAYGRSSIEI